MLFKIQFLDCLWLFVFDGFGLRKVYRLASLDDPILPTAPELIRRIRDFDTPFELKAGVSLSSKVYGFCALWGVRAQNLHLQDFRVWGCLGFEFEVL